MLIGYDEYQRMKAAVDLMQRPEVVDDIKTGLKELDEGKGVLLTEIKTRVREAIRMKETNKLAQELAAESGMDSHIVETIIDHLGEKMMSLFSAQGSPLILRVEKSTRIRELILSGRRLSPTLFTWKPRSDTLSRKEFVQQ